MVKNAVIVPVGRQGRLRRQAPAAAATARRCAPRSSACYRTFIRGLLDLTDNIVGGEVVPPPDVVRYDDDDPYLVVAADKGTATFSDIANAISPEYGFWLGDAFASGGSAGYDHKKMGITARGAWESVKRHFRELGHRHRRATDFTVVGIGDMSGDVFGNGMLLSRHIKLVAAFNHRAHLPRPRPRPGRASPSASGCSSCRARRGPTTTRTLISAGGGVFPRTAKSIPLSPEARAAARQSTPRR